MPSGAVFETKMSEKARQYKSLPTTNYGQDCPRAMTDRGTARVAFMKRAHRALDRLANLQPMRSILQTQYDRTFAANQTKNLFRGVFETFEEAQSSAPTTLPLGYDNPASASLYKERTRKAYSTDYPVMFWLQKLLAEGCTTVFDLGGHIGVSYYAYQRFLSYPAALRWVVHDVTAVLERGRAIAEDEDQHRYLSFSADFNTVDGMEILIALGSLQYLPETLANRLTRLKVLPSHLILNLTPLHDQASYFTLQHVGTALCPYRITAFPAFLQSLQELGYILVDHWENPEKKCEIPFYPDRSLDKYHGFYFRLPN
jgi:putative methyltransferase (TIGR04325 family)